MIAHTITKVKRKNFKFGLFSLGKQVDKRAGLNLALQIPQLPDRIPHIHARLAYGPVHQGSRADHHVVTDGNGQHCGIRADRDMVADNGLPVLGPVAPGRTTACK